MKGESLDDVEAKRIDNPSFAVLLDSIRIRLLGLLVLLLGISTFAEGKFIDLEDVNGRSIRAEFVEVNEEGTVTIRREDGRLFRGIPLQTFSKESRTKFAAWLERQKELEENPVITAESDLRIRFSRGRDEDLNKDGDPDDRVVEMEPVVSILNNDFNKTYRDVRGIVVVIGESVISPGEMKILFKEEFTLTLPFRETVRWEGKRFTNRYDANPGNGSGYGYKYEDYLIILYDPDGKPVLKRSSRKKHEENYTRILKARPNKSYDEDFEITVPESRV